MAGDPRKEQYRLAKTAIKEAGLKWLTIDPEEDYIEVQCPECKNILTFHFDELDKIRCEKCYKRRCQEDFYHRCEELVEAAGFTLNTAIFEEDYIEIECPSCGEVTSLYSSELDNICCRYCAMEEAARENGYKLYMGENIEGEPWENQFDEWFERTRCDWGAALVCPNCEKTHFFEQGSRSTREIVDYVRNYKCDCSFSIAAIREIAHERGFSVETKSSPYGGYELEQGEIAFLCNRCGEAIIHGIKELGLEDKTRNLNCECDSNEIEFDHLAWTLQGKLAWCSDLLRVISLVKLITFNQFAIDGSNHFRFPEEGDKEVFFAVDPEDVDYAYAFVVYPNEKDAWLSKYLLFRFEIASWGTPRVDVEISARWPYYYDKLYEAIRQDIEHGDKRVISVAEKNFDRYISAYNALYDHGSVIWHVGSLLTITERFSNKLSKLAGDEPTCDDRYLQEYINLHMCPVCKKAYTSGEQRCSQCSFAGLNKVFVNKQDAENWMQQVVIPYRQRYHRLNR